MRGTVRRVIFASFAMASCGFLSFGCGEATKSTPSPEAIETAESVARDVTFEAPASSTPEAGDEEEDPVVLDGRVFGSGPAGVILAHMRPADQTSWFPFATELAKSGRFTILTFDFRGFGKSTGDKEFDKVDTDLTAAYKYMRDELGIGKIFLVGASMGGTASLVVSAQLPVAGVISISSQAEFQELNALEAAPSISAPKLFVTSEDDVPAQRSLEELWAVARAPKSQQIYEGNEHGTDLLLGDNGPAVSERLTQFLTSN
jgi:pimeloyl-ACP methyl ester carboxylesterase